MQCAKLVLSVTYDPAKTTADDVASALDQLLETATSTPGVLSDQGNPELGVFYVESYRDLAPGE